MNVVLVRVLYAHALVLDGDLALGRLSFLARLIGHPVAGGPQALLSMKDVLPDSIRSWTRNGGAHRRREQAGPDDGLRGDPLAGRRACTPLRSALNEPPLLDLIRDGKPAYAWPADQRDVWQAAASSGWRS